MNCNGCNQKLEGIAYSHKDKIFCGKGCLVKYLKGDRIVKMVLVK